MKRPYKIKPYTEYLKEHDLPDSGSPDSREEKEIKYIVKSKMNHLKDLWDQGEYDFDAMLEEAKLFADGNNVARIGWPNVHLTQFAKRVEYLTQQLVDIGN